MSELNTEKNIITATEVKIYTGVAARILNILCSGCTESEAAMAVGVSEGYIRALKTEPDFISQIKKKLTENVERAVEIDENYAEMERLATNRLKTYLPLVSSPRDLMAIAAFANSAKKKTSIAGMHSEKGSENAKTVQILMPTVILNNFSMNPNNEIVAVDGRELTTLNSASINSVVKSKEAELLELAKNRIIPERLESNPALININPNRQDQSATKYRSKYNVSEADLDEL